MASSTTNEKAEEGIKARLGKDSKERGTEGGKRKGREEDLDSPWSEASSVAGRATRKTWAPVSSSCPAPQEK